MDDLISRQAAIKVVDAVWSVTGDKNVAKVWDQIKDLPSAQPEPAISLSWINKHIEWLKSLDNSFAELTVMQISTMVKTWKDEQDE